MAATSANARVTVPDNSLVSVRPTMAKAALSDKVDISALSLVVKDSAKKAHGKQGAAAAVLHKDEGNFARDISAGRFTLGDMAGLGPEFLAEMGRALLEHYGPMSTPQARARQRIRDARSILDELDQFLEFIA